ncbi:MAG: response regulator [Myxococcota bacterium]
MKLSVLVVDDSSITRRAQIRMLGMTSFEVDILDQAVDGEMAIERLAKTEYDIVMCDLHMPRLGGVGVLSATRAGRCLGSPKFVFITSDHSPERRAALLKAGADAYLLKPLSPQGLQECLDRLFSSKAAA